MPKRAARAGENERLDPTSLVPVDLARLLAKAGGEPITEDMINDDIAEGAPTNAGGRINLIHYTAWLVRVSQEN